MKTSLEKQDIESIALAVRDLMKPLLKRPNSAVDECLLTNEEAAEFLRVKVSWLCNNELPGKCKIGEHVRYRKSRLLKYIAEQEIPTTGN